MSDAFPVWVTRWCLSSGIEEAAAWEFPGNKEWVVIASGRMRGSIMQAGQWHRTRPAAAKEAERVRQYKMREHRKMLADLEEMKFDGGENEGIGHGTGEGAGQNQGGTEGQPEPAL